MRAVVVVVGLIFVGLVAAYLVMVDGERRTIVIDTVEVRDDFAQKGWIPSTLLPGATLWWDIDTNACTINAATMPVGAIEGNLLLVGDKRWLIVSMSPVVLHCLQ